MQISTMVAQADRQRRGVFAMAKRKAASASPLLATTLLTAAIFLLPAPGAQEARASASEAANSFAALD